MLKAVFRPNELVTLTDKIIIDSPTSFPEMAHLAPIEEVKEDLSAIEEYTGPTADDLRREAEYFKAQWEEEKKRMIAQAKSEADNIIKDAQNTASAEIKNKSDEALVLKQKAEEEAQKIITEAQLKAKEFENESRIAIENERKEAVDSGKTEGKEEGYAYGKAEVDRLIERTQVVLERAQDKRADILSETEKQIIGLVLLISRKVIKVLSENQRNIIISNVVEALRKVKSKGDIIIRVNLADLQLATEHKEDFIRLIEKSKSLQIIEDSTVDPGGCIIETDFGEIDARIASQLSELENKILEISPAKLKENDNIPQPVIRTASINNELAASAIMNSLKVQSETEELVNEIEEENDDELSAGANAALTASAALAALATMATKGKREADRKIKESIENLGKRKSDGQP